MATLVEYTGSFTRTYTQYLNEGAGGHTLVAQPAVMYTLTVAEGWNGLLSAPPADGLWVASTVGLLSFTATPGLAIPGALAPGFGGVQQASSARLSVLAAVTEVASEPAVPAREFTWEDWEEWLATPVPAGDPVQARLRIRMKQKMLHSRPLVRA